MTTAALTPRTPSSITTPAQRPPERPPQRTSALALSGSSKTLSGPPESSWGVVCSRGGSSSGMRRVRAAMMRLFSLFASYRELTLSRNSSTNFLYGSTSS